MARYIRHAAVSIHHIVGSLKIYVFFAESSLFYRALLQTRPIILRSLLIVATKSCRNIHAYAVGIKTRGMSRIYSSVNMQVMYMPHETDSLAVDESCRTSLRMLWRFKNVVCHVYIVNMHFIYMTHDTDSVTHLSDSIRESCRVGALCQGIQHTHTHTYTRTSKKTRTRLDTKCVSELVDYHQFSVI